MRKLPLSHGEGQRLLKVGFSMKLHMLKVLHRGRSVEKRRSISTGLSRHVLHGKLLVFMLKMLLLMMLELVEMLLLLLLEMHLLEMLKMLHVLVV